MTISVEFVKAKPNYRFTTCDLCHGRVHNKEIKIKRKKKKGKKPRKRQEAPEGFKLLSTRQFQDKFLLDKKKVIKYKLIQDKEKHLAEQRRLMKEKNHA